MLKYNKYELALSVILIVLGITAFSPYYQPFFPIKLIFTFVFVLFSIGSLFRIEKKLISFFLPLTLYLAYSVSLILFKKLNLLDYLTAFICFYYTLLLLFFPKKNLISVNFFNNFFRGLLIVFILRYSYHAMTIPMRPRLFMENNFELLFLSILLIGNISYSKKPNFLNLVMFSFVAISSGSRSGIAIYFFILFACFFKRDFIKVKYIWIYTLIATGLYISWTMILKRMPEGGLQEIDRVRFLFLFFEEFKAHDWWTYFIGTPIITPLSPETCNALVFYKELFSYRVDGSCYSVVFHSFILRIIFDHGIIALFFIFSLIQRVLALSDFPRRHIIAILGVLFLNSLSISSINSIFSVFGLMIILIVKPQRAEENAK